MSLDAFSHRAVNIYAKSKGIKTVHLFHGIQSIYNYNSPKPFGNSNIVKRVWQNKSHLLKGVIFFWPMYLKSLYLTHSNFVDYKEFFKNLFTRIMGKMDIIAPKSSKADLAFVYINADVEYAVKRYSYNKINVIPIGNPDIVEKLPKLNYFQKPIKNKKLVTYLDTSLFNYGYCFKNISDFQSHLLDLNTFLKKINYQFSVKLHPMSEDSNLIKKIKSEGIKIVNNSELFKVLSESNLVLVEPSSLVALPMILELPIGLVKWGKVKSISDYGKLLENYPRSYSINCYQDIRDTLNTFNTVNNLSVWKNNSLGPFDVSSKDIVNRSLKNLII